MAREDIGERGQWLFCTLLTELCGRNDPFFRPRPQDAAAVWNLSGAGLIITPQWSKQRWTMLFWKSWIDAVQFGLEAQGVIAMRLMKIAAGGQDGAAECLGMVLEKFDAATAAHSAGTLALAGGKSAETATRLAMVPVKRRVRLNHLRLIRG